MDKQKVKAKIIQKIPLKSKLVMKSTLTEKSELMVARFGFQDSLVAAGYSDGKVRIFNMNTDNKIAQIDTHANSQQKHRTPVNALRWRPTSSDLSSINSVLLVANTDGNLFQYVAKTGKQLYHETEQDNFIMAVDYANNGKLFCTAGKDYAVRVYDEQTKKVTKLQGLKWHSHGHSNRIYSVKFSPEDPNIVASGGSDLNVNIWDIRQGKSIATIYGPKIAGDSIDIRDNHILTGSNRGTDQLQLWDWRMNKIQKKFRWDQQKQQTSAFIFSAQFCHNSKDTIIAAGGNQMKMFSLTDSSEMLEVRSDETVKANEYTSLYACDSGYTSNKYLMGGNTGTLFYMAGVKSYE